MIHSPPQEIAMMHLLVSKKAVEAANVAYQRYAPEQVLKKDM